MSDNITSHNQSGGITAKTVTVGSSTVTSTTESAKPEKPNRSKRAWLLISGGIGLLAALAGILQYLGVHLW